MRVASKTCLPGQAHLQAKKGPDINQHNFHHDRVAFFGEICHSIQVLSPSSPLRSLRRTFASENQSACARELSTFRFRSYFKFTMAADNPPPYSPTASTATSPPTGPIVFVIGPPGSGKSTLCSRLCQQNPDSFRHLSVGDYLRKLCETDESGFPSRGHWRISKEEVARHLKESRLLPPDTIIPLIQAKLFEDSSSPTSGWLIDGFPRDIETALAFEKEVGVLFSLFGDSTVGETRC